VVPLLFHLLPMIDVEPKLLMHVTVGTMNAH
jgi:hypothetical protein